MNFFIINARVSNNFFSIYEENDGRVWANYKSKHF